MGAWGEGLYDDDEACDVRDTVSLLAKMPASGDEILALLLEQFRYSENLDDDGCPSFWMVVADQFAKYGIACEKAQRLGREAIESGADIQDLQARGMEQIGLKGRKKTHEKVLQRLASPKTESARRIPKSPPSSVVAVGEIYSYPTMNGKGMNAWFSDWNQAGFRPDGWGALIILASGRIFDWFPWSAYSPVNVNPLTEPVLQDVLFTKTLFKNGVAYFSPKQSHMKRMGMRLLGSVQVNVDAVSELQKLASHKPKDAVMCDWSICSGAFSTGDPNLGLARVQDLMAK